jgi:hypothetical protein
VIRRGQKPIADTVARLESRIDELEQELRRRTPALPAATPGWEDGDPDAGDGGARGVSHAWLSLLEPPVRRRPRVPRLPFEVLFLVACAVAAGVADLGPRRIAIVMGVAWLLVALTEWSATVADRRRREEMTIAPPQRVATGAAGADRAWYLAPVERTVITGPFAESATAIGLSDTQKISRRDVPPDLESTVERRAADAEG